MIRRLANPEELAEGSRQIRESEDRLRREGIEVVEPGRGHYRSPEEGRDPIQEFFDFTNGNTSFGTCCSRQRAARWCHGVTRWWWSEDEQWGWEAEKEKLESLELKEKARGLKKEEVESEEIRNLRRLWSLCSTRINSRGWTRCIHRHRFCRDKSQRWKDLSGCKLRMRDWWGWERSVKEKERKWLGQRCWENIHLVKSNLVEDSRPWEAERGSEEGQWGD